MYDRLYRRPDTTSKRRQSTDAEKARDEPRLGSAKSSFRQLYDHNDRLSISERSSNSLLTLDKL